MTSSVESQFLGMLVPLDREGEVGAFGMIISFSVSDELFCIDADDRLVFVDECALFGMLSDADPDITARHRRVIDGDSATTTAWCPGGRAGFDPTDQGREETVKRINKAFPAPLARVPPSPFSSEAFESLAVGARLPPGTAGRFITAGALTRLPKLRAMEKQSFQFIYSRSLLVLAEKDGVKAHCQMRVGVLKALCVDFDLPTHGLKQSLIDRLVENGKPARLKYLEVSLNFDLSFAKSRYSAVACAPACKSAVVSFLDTGHELGRRTHLDVVMSTFPASYQPPVTVTALASVVQSLIVAEKQRQAAKRGWYYQHLPGQPSQIVDVDHTFHNWITKLIWGQLGQDPAFFLVSIIRLRAAAETVKDEVLSKILECSYDKHSHMCSLYVATHRGLLAQLRELGHIQDAEFIEALGLAWRAWKQRGLPMEKRFEYLWQFRLVVYRVFGFDALANVDVLRSTHIAGMITNQLLDLLAGIDVFEHTFFSLSAAQQASFNASSLTTRGLENSFSFLASNTCSGEKFTMDQIKGSVRRSDSLAALIRLNCGPGGEGGYTHQESRRRRKLQPDTSLSWSDGTADDDAFFRDIHRRARGYCGNRMQIRDINKYKGGQ